MTTEKVEYDAAIGGTVQLPDNIPTYKYTGDRLVEIKSLLTAINNPTQTKLVFQTLPKHMRRRAMSHNPKRLPRKYQQAHIAQMRKSGVPAKNKRPSRKYRRKANNLLKEYVRRQKRNIWLETHIWHAKRFHMTEKWGYKLPQSSCDKTFRSNYRATSKHCLMQDISYMGAIQLSAPIDSIRKNFEKMYSPKCGLSICAKAYINGYREGTIDLFKQKSYPFGALGPINFIWKPEEDSQQQVRTLWLFSHPSFYRDLVNELVGVFKLTEVSENVTQPKAPMEGNNNDQNDKTQKNILKTPEFVNSKRQVKLLVLKDNLNRFRLTGPLSHAVLTNAFKTFIDKSKSPTWFNRFITNSLCMKAHFSQSEYWSSISSINSPAELSPHLVLALNIQDPRINRPKKRTKALPEEDTSTNQFNEAVLQIPKYNCVSPIWNQHFRLQLLKDKISAHEFCTLRNKHALVPGEPCAFENDIQPVPVLLIQRPGSQNGRFKRLNYGCGWDVIIPAGYGISTWMCLIMWGAKAGGLRETETIHRESGFDEFLPDTIAAATIAEERAKELRAEYFKLPQNKRPNYRKLSMVSPFKCPWSQLILNWTNPPASTYYALRERELLQKIQSIMERRLPITTVTIKPNSLIPVYLQMETRGHPGNFSIICLPKRIDLKDNLKKIRNLNYEPLYTEPLKTDEQEPQRKKLRREHLKLLKRLRRRRVRAKKRKQETSEKRILIAKPGTAKLIAEQRKKMCELWLPEHSENIRHQCSREVFGYLTQSDFSFTEATVAGVGYVTLNGLMDLVNICSKGVSKVLVRGTDTRQYRLATLKVRV